MTKKIKQVEVVDNVDATLDTLNGKSAKIRYLTSEGWNRKDIAVKLGIRYQHVRNVQVTLLKKDIQS